jgi:hypothetical protein
LYKYSKDVPMASAPFLTLYLSSCTQSYFVSYSIVMLVKLLGDDTYVRSNLLCIFMPRCLFTYLYIPDNEQTILNVEEDYINILLLFVQIQVAHAVAIKRQYANI